MQAMMQAKEMMGEGPVRTNIFEPRGDLYMWVLKKRKLKGRGCEDGDWRSLPAPAATRGRERVEINTPCDG